MGAKPRRTFRFCRGAPIAPRIYESWAALFAAQPTKGDYLLTPGDYSSWGTKPGDDTS